MLAALLPLAAQASTEDGGSSLIEPIPGLMVWTIICFAITFFVLRKFAFGPIQKAIDERRDRIRRSIDEADRARTEARKLLEEHRALIGQARRDAEEILSEARRIAESQRERARLEADEDRKRRLEETKRQIEAETQNALGAIRRQVAELALLAAEKVTAKSLTADDHRRLIDDAIRELDFSKLEKEPV